MDQSSHFVNGPYTHRALAALYGVSRRTLQRWLAPFAGEIGPKVGYYYRPNQVATIFQRLGHP